jgi:hypothetical protein
MSVSFASQRTRGRIGPLARYGGAFIVSLVVSLGALGASHQVALKNPVVIVFLLLLALPSLVAAARPAAGLAVLLVAALISWAVPALIPQLSALGPETTFGVAVLSSAIGLLLGSFDRRERLTGTPLLAPLAVCAAWIIITFAWNAWHTSGSSHSPQFTVFVLLQGLFFLYAANAVRAEKTVWRLLYLLVFISIPISVIAYLQYGFRYLGIDYTAIHSALQTLAEHLTFKVRVAGTLSDAGILSFFYLTVFVIATALLCIERQRWLRVALLFTIAFTVWPFLVTFTKSTIVVVLLTLLVLAAMRRSWQVAVGSVVGAIAGWTALSLIPFSQFLANLGFHAFDYGLSGDGDITQRLHYMGQCAATVPGHLIFGLGPLGAQQITGSHCHSLPVEVVTDFGVIGVLLFGWLIWRVYLLSWRVFKAGATGRLWLLPTAQPMDILGTLAQVNMALLVGFGVLALLWPLINFSIPWFWMMIALVVGGVLSPTARTTVRAAGDPLAPDETRTPAPAWIDYEGTAQESSASLGTGKPT